jgi:hypothetical protein
MQLWASNATAAYAHESPVAVEIVFDELSCDKDRDQTGGKVR